MCNGINISPRHLLCEYYDKLIGLLGYYYTIFLRAAGKQVPPSKGTLISFTDFILGRFKINQPKIRSLSTTNMTPDTYYAILRLI
jgi:hypothetical protein